MINTPTKLDRGRVLRRFAAVAALVLVATGCNPASWGVRTSYRNYIAGPIAHGTIEATEGATWSDGPGFAKGPFTFKLTSSTFDHTTNTGELILGGKVSTRGHWSETLGGHILELNLSDIRVEINDTTGTLYADLEYRQFVSTNPSTLPALETADDAPFATLDLSGVDWTPDGNGDHVITDAPAVGVASTMQLIGWDAFYGSPTPALDPFSVKFPASFEARTPAIIPSKTTGLVPGETITVIGTGFDPNANTGTRPPLSGQKSGVYIVFGKFADNWKPSAGAPSSARKVISQRWALPTSSYNVMNPNGTNADYVEIDENGRFVAELTVTEDVAAGNYGFYTYPGSGATNAKQEVAVLASFQAAA